MLAHRHSHVVAVVEHPEPEQYLGHADKSSVSYFSRDSHEPTSQLLALQKCMFHYGEHVGTYPGRSLYTIVMLTHRDLELFLLSTIDILVIQVFADRR
jgi:hypothetical protein